MPKLSKMPEMPEIQETPEVLETVAIPDGWKLRLRGLAGAFSTAVLVAQLIASSVQASTVVVKKVTGEISTISPSSEMWKGATVQTLSLIAQPMIAPRPKTTTTQTIQVSAVQNGEWIAYRIQWQDPEPSYEGKLGGFSDGVALQFPVNDNANPPPVFMGAKGNPVHIFHWKASYQADSEKKRRDVKDAYPNTNIDIYPFEFADYGSLEKPTEEMRDIYVHGKAAGNPQAFVKQGAVDELIAEGFGTTSTRAVPQEGRAFGAGSWKDGKWSVVVTRKLMTEGGSKIEPNKPAPMAFAIWQGGKQEVGARKSITFNWIPVEWK